MLDTLTSPKYEEPVMSTVKPASLSPRVNCELFHICQRLQLLKSADPTSSSPNHVPARSESSACNWTFFVLLNRRVSSLTVTESPRIALPKIVTFCAGWINEIQR